MGCIVWLASYPKSGNTWFRVFLTNYLRDRDEPASINALEATPIASGRQDFADALGVDASDFGHDDYDAMRPAAYRVLAARATETRYMKVHDAQTLTRTGEPLLPPEATDRAVYFVRDPRDVAVSFANHLSATVDTAITVMGDEDYAFCSGVRGAPLQLRQRLLTWSGHVASWVDAPGFPVHVVRYEDMIADPDETFASAIRFLGLPFDADRLARAIGHSSFAELRRQEEDGGFQEAPPRCAGFFNVGTSGTWRSVLDDEQVARITGAHGPTMGRLGYLSERVGRAEL